MESIRGGKLDGRLFGELVQIYASMFRNDVVRSVCLVSVVYDI